MSRILLIRFGALGDLCLLAWSLGSSGERAGGEPARERATGKRVQVTLVTKQRFADLATQMPGVDTVIPLAGSRFRDVWHLARQLRSHHYDAIIDAHGNLRSHLLLGLLGRTPQSRLAKDTFARLFFLTWRRPSPKLSRTMRERFDAIIPPEVKAGDKGATDQQAGPATARTWLQPPLAHLRPSPAPSAPTIPPILGIAPGAHWATKRWPDKHFCSLLQKFKEVSEWPVHIFLGPQEARWFPHSELAALARGSSSVTVWQNTDLIGIARALAACATLVTNDSGLSHLAEAVGTPVLVLFGPTVREFGYFPTLPDSRVMEVDLSCRPCSRNGKRSCFRGDLACLERITPTTVLATLLDMPPWRTSAAGVGERT